jgi:2-C-methyl-D-erythritol 4-phosphate cytidylyltransferase
MGSDKLWADLCGKPLLAWPLLVLANCAAIDEVVIAVSAESRERVVRLTSEIAPRARVVLGGPRRQDSVLAALAAASGAEWVVVHDGARPLLTAKLIEDGLAAAEATGAAIAAVPVADTIKQVKGAMVEQTLERSQLRAVQTPQVFRRTLLVDAHASGADDATDDAALVERIGGQVRVYEADNENIKVTTPADLEIARALLARRQ